MKFNSLSKVLFDLAMLVLLAAVYCAQPTGIPIHEYIGLVIYIFFIIHLAYNYRWIINAGKKFFDKTIGVRVKIIYAVDCLLLIAFVLIGLSGVMISHVVFKFGRMPFWRPAHSAASAVSLVLLAVHIGLHGKMIINTVKNRVPLPFAVIKTTASILLAVLLLAGIYGDVVSKIQPSQNQVTGRPRYETVLALFERSVNLLNGPPEYVRNRMAGAGENAANRNGHGDQAQRPPQQNAVSPGTIAVSVSNYLAFIILCSIVVYLIDKGAKRRGVTPRGGNRTMAQGIAG